MARGILFFFFAAAAVCLISLAGYAAADDYDSDRFHIDGTVYCDTCRVQFVTRLGKFLEGAKVRLECTNRENGTKVLTKEATTDKSGHYSMEVRGDHEDEECEIVLVESPDPECSEVPKVEHLRNAAKVSLTANDGIVSNETRSVDPLGFMTKSPLHDCAQTFQELGIIPDITF